MLGTCTLSPCLLHYILNVSLTHTLQAYPTLEASLTHVPGCLIASCHGHGHEHITKLGSQGSSMAVMQRARWQCRSELLLISAGSRDVHQFVPLRFDQIPRVLLIFLGSSLSSFRRTCEAGAECLTCSIPARRGRGRGRGLRLRHQPSSHAGGTRAPA